MWWFGVQTEHALCQKICKLFVSVAVTCSTLFGSDGHCIVTRREMMIVVYVTAFAWIRYVAVSCVSATAMQTCHLLGFVMSAASGCMLLVIVPPNKTYRWPKIFLHFFVHLITAWNIDQFETFFTIKIRRKFIILSLKIPPHLKCVATLPCEMSMS